MANVSKPVCKYGSSCYRKNPQHLRAYSHPNPEENEDACKKGKENVNENDSDDSGGPSSAKRAKLSETEEQLEQQHTVEAERGGGTNKMAFVDEDCDTINVVEPEKQQVDASMPVTDSDSIGEKIHKLFLVNMPEDFYQFWDFCVEVCPEDPLGALKPVGLSLTGPYDVLAGRLENKTWEECVVHGRHFFDPPELQTVLMDDTNDQGFHIGYFRDDPKSNDFLLVSNTVSSGCSIKVIGTNIFAVVSSLFQKAPKGSSTSLKLLQKLESSLINKAESLGINLKNTSTPKRKAVSKCFNGIGISVPIDEVNDVGYRSLTMTNRELRSLLDKITKQSVDSASERLQELITFVQFANDECDYGMGLELGIDLFCYGAPTFHRKILHLLSLAYDLLDRPEFGKIVQQHLKNREKPKFVLT